MKTTRNFLFITFLFVLLQPTDGFSTAQIPDYLIYNGETYPIFNNPLESSFNQKNPRPYHLFVRTCTACWRGYVATWKIENGFLYLHKIVEGTCASKPAEITLSILFPNRKEPVRADWFTGTLRIPQGKQLRYIHMGYGSVYEKEVLLFIQAGQLIKEELLDNTKKKLPSWEEKSLDELNKLREWEERNKVKK